MAEPPVKSAEMTSAFRHACPQLGGQTYLLFLSRIHPKKGVDLLIRAYAEVVHAERPSPSARLPETGRGEPERYRAVPPALVIAGPLDSEYANQMQRLAAELGLADVHFPGMLTGDAKWGAFYGCQAFILPSHQENFGIAVVEALACGKPALISDQVNICDTILDAQAGLVCEVGQKDVAGLLRRWLSFDDEHRVAMSAQAETCYRDNFLPSNAATRFCDSISLSSSSCDLQQIGK